MNNRNSIDIIIPIYNAYDDLCKCIESIKKYTDLEKDRLILINDVSSDKRVYELLKELQSDSIICITNKENRGFSNNVNIGMMYSVDRDVILLNSDTIVTSGWVNKIYRCAYSKDEIGTVTPMSNSATLCSYPIMCQDNEIPQNITIDELGEVIENCSCHVYPQITVAVGFCMFIKRKVIEDVGLFDAVTFEKGYGEENDFCNRAEQLGYIHVMCDDTFIFHKGTVSFCNEEKQKLIQAHDEILNERYKNQMRNNHIYCVTNPDQYIRDNIDVHLSLKNNKKNLLYMIHLDFRDDAYGHVGGTQFHVKDLVEKFKAEYNLFVVARDEEYIRLTIYVDNVRHTFKFYVGAASKFFQYRNYKFKELFGNILDVFKIDIVHIHHVDTLSFDMFYQAKNRNINLIVTIHDYYFVCPNVKLLDANDVYCHGKCSIGDCKSCLMDKFDISVTTNYLDVWRNECRNVLEMCDCIIIPSNSAKDIFVSYYPEIAKKVLVIGHGTDIDNHNQNIMVDNAETNVDILVSYDEIKVYQSKYISIKGWAFLKNRCNDSMGVFLKVEDGKGNKKYYKCKKNRREDVAYEFGSRFYINAGFSCKLFLNELMVDNITISVIIQDKENYYLENGSKVIDGCKFIGVTNNKKKRIAFIGGMVTAKGSGFAYDMIVSTNNTNLEWYIFGDIGDNRLTELEQDNLFKIGNYSHNELPLLVNTFEIDLVCILPIWPETFCYTLSEAVLCGMPVVATDIGAVGERIRENKYGWLVPVNSSAEQICNKICSVFEDKAEYDRVKHIVENYSEKTVKGMSEEYKKLYDNLDYKVINYERPDYYKILQGLIIKGRKCNKQDGEVYKEYRMLAEENKCLNTIIEKKDSEIQGIKNSKSYRYTQKILSIVRRKKC